jgi:hypothetical protein
MTPDTSRIAEEIEKAAKAATPGAWIADAEYDCMLRDEVRFHIANVFTNADRSYIVAVQPLNALAILSERRALLAKVERLEKALKSVLARDSQWGQSGAPNDCGCINLSRKTEIEYETGQCPHQIARAALTEGT